MGDKLDGVELALKLEAAERVYYRVPVLGDFALSREQVEAVVTALTPPVPPPAPPPEEPPS